MQIKEQRVSRQQSLICRSSYVSHCEWHLIKWAYLTCSTRFLRKKRIQSLGTETPTTGFIKDTETKMRGQYKSRSEINLIMGINWNRVPQNTRNAIIFVHVTDIPNVIHFCATLQ
jgi:hypothetical protein